MSDLICRQEAVNAIQKRADKVDSVVHSAFWEGLIIAQDIVEKVPSAEPERKKGEWIKVGHFGRSYKCNQCGNYLDFDGVNAGRGDANFCPNCGARMTRGE